MLCLDNRALWRKGQNWGGDSQYGNGFYFSGGKAGAFEWSHSTNAVEAYLDIKNPLYVTEATPETLYAELRPSGFSREWGMKNGGNFVGELKSQGKDVPAVLLSYGYDGIIDESKHRPLRGLEEKDMYQYIAFSPEQIKSADNKTPTSDPDIRYSSKVKPVSQNFTSDTSFQINFPRYSLTRTFCL